MNLPITDGMCTPTKGTCHQITNTEVLVLALNDSECMQDRVEVQVVKAKTS